MDKGLADSKNEIKKTGNGWLAKSQSGGCFVSVAPSIDIFKYVFVLLLAHA